MRNFTLFKNMLWLALVFVTGNAMAQTNLLSNAGFEDWADGVPTEWKSTTTASNATLSQSTEAHEGSYSVLVAGTSSNKRLAYKEITLKAGTYTFSFYAKAATEESGSVAPGYTPITDGKVGSYKYGTYANNLSDTEWTLVSYEFTLAEETTLNLVIMNSKNPGKNVLVDNASLTTGDGGLVEGGEDPDPVDPDPVDPIVPSSENLLLNAGFEDWADGVLAEWKSTTTASSATLSQSTEAYEGSYSVLVAGASSNKRLAYKEITLKAGTYTFAFYAKSATAELGSVRPGYVPVTDGAVGSYAYGNYANNLSDTEWTLVSYEFTLAAETTLNLVIMNPKSPGKDVLVDNASLTTEDGGLVEGGEPVDPDPVETYSYKKATTVESGKPYLLVAEVDGAYKVAAPLSGIYGYLQVVDATVDGENITLTTQANEFVFTATDGGYTILGSDSRYLYQTGTYNSFNVSAEPTDGQVWAVEANADGTFKIMNTSVDKYVQYSVGFTSYGSYADEQGLMPYLYEPVTEGGNAIANVDVDAENAPVEVYTLGGVKVGNSLNGLAKGIYVVKQGNEVKKVMK